MKTENDTDNADIEQVARKTISDGYIKIIDLMEIMAVDEAYISILPRLREEYLPKGWIGPQTYVGEDSAGDDEKWVEPVDLLKTSDGRFYYWMNLIKRWAGLDADVVKERLPDIAYLECYRHDRRVGKYNIIDRGKTTPDHIRDFINLDELKKYLENVEYILQVQFPLPKLLFPKIKEFERSQSIEKATWKEHIEPIVKLHGLKRLSGERFEYQFIDKKIDEHAVRMMMQKTMFIKDLIKSTLRQHGIPEDEFEQIDPYDCSYDFKELLYSLKDAGNRNAIKSVSIKIGEKILNIDIDFKEVFRSFLEDCFKDKTLPVFLEMLRGDFGSPLIEARKKKLRPNQEAKLKCRNITEKLRENYPKMRSKEIAARSELEEVAGNYTLETRRRWIADLFPDNLRKSGRRKKGKGT